MSDHDGPVPPDQPRSTEPVNLWLPVAVPPKRWYQRRLVSLLAVMVVLVVGVGTVVWLVERPHFASPQTIGVHLVRSVDQSEAANALDGLTWSRYPNPYAAVYNDPSGNTVTVWGSVVWPLFEGNVQTEIDSFFSAQQQAFPAQPLSGRAPIGTGSAGGQAECAGVTLSTSYRSAAVCKWIGRDMWLDMFFSGFRRSDSDALVPGILSAIVIG